MVSSILLLQSTFTAVQTVCLPGVKAPEEENKSSQCWNLCFGETVQPPLLSLDSGPHFWPSSPNFLLEVMRLQPGLHGSAGKPWL